MRLIGHLASESTARVFGDFLYVQGIENKLEDQSDGHWAVWVSDEDKIGDAVKLLESFRANPTDPKYHTGKGASVLRAEEEKNQEAYRKRMRTRRHLFRPLNAYGFGPVTFVLIVASVAVFFLSRFGTDQERILSLFITDFSMNRQRSDPSRQKVAQVIA